jgi:DNA-binding SARP family transcriptional activator
VRGYVEVGVVTNAAALRINILGSLECWARGTRIRPGGPIHEWVLVSLLLDVDQVLPVSRLVQAVWDDDPPATATHQVRKAIAQLRQVLPGGADLIVTEGPGYRAVSSALELDLSLFQGFVRAAKLATDAGSTEEIVRNLDSALALWRGPVLLGVGSAVIGAASTMWEERRLAALEQLLELRLSRGDLDELILNLRELVAAHPLREALYGLLMRALFAVGRQAEALEQYTRVRELLAEELGIDPGEALNRLYGAILRSDSRLLRQEPVPAPPQRPEPVGSAAEPTAVANGSNLPYDLRDFTGRKWELSSLLRYVQEPGAQGLKIVAIDGMGGSGKTSLAVHAAHKLADRYGHGQLYLDLHGFTPDEEPLSADEVAAALLRMLGVPGEHISDQPDVRFAQWRSMATQYSLLVLLDNVRAVGQVLPILHSPSNSLVLITSRARLIDLDGAHWISLGEMTPEDSVALVAETVGKERVAAEPGFTAQLVELCGHLPLALRIATARLRNRPRWQIAYLVDRLRNEARRLDELRSNERSVRLTFTLSYMGLDAEHRDALRLIGCHPGRAIDLYSAAALLDTDIDGAERILEDLLDAHLMQQERIGYYTFHDLVRAFTQELVDRGGSEQASAARRLLEYYLAATETACDLLFPGRAMTPIEWPARLVTLPDLSDADRARQWLADEEHSLRGAIALAYRVGLYRHTADLARNVVFQLYRRGQFEQYREVVGFAVDASRQLGDLVRLRLSLSNQAVADWRLGRIESALAAATEAFEIAVALRDRRGEAKDIGILGLLQATLGRFDEALFQLRHSITLKRELGAARAEAESLTNLSSLYEQWGRYREAIDAAQRAVELNRELGARENELVALADLALATLGVDEPELADRYLEDALEVIDANSSPGDIAIVRALSATVSARLGRLDQASEHAESAMRLSRTGSTPLRRIEVENIMGRFRHVERDYTAAVVLHTSALRLASSVGYRVEEAHALQGLANAHHALGETHTGNAFGSRADELYDELGIPDAARLRP